MQKYECGNCYQLFDEKERICEHWRIKEKSLVCPRCEHYLVETYDDTLSNKVGNWFLASLITISLVFIIVVLDFEARRYENTIFAVGVLLVAPLMLGYRVLSVRRVMGKIETKSIGKSNM